MQKCEILDLFEIIFFMRSYYICVIKLIMYVRDHFSHTYIFDF